MLPLRWQSCMFNRRTLLVRVGVIRMRCTGKECIDIYQYRQQDRGGNGSHQKLLRDNAVYKSKDECADVKKNQQDCSDQCHDTF